MEETAASTEIGSEDLAWGRLLAATVAMALVPDEEAGPWRERW